MNKITRRVFSLTGVGAIASAVVAPKITPPESSLWTVTEDAGLPKWHEEDYSPRWRQIGQASVPADRNATTIRMADSECGIIAGNILVIPRPLSDLGPPEACRVSKADGGVLTVVRDIGGNALWEIPANGYVLILGGAA